MSRDGTPPETQPFRWVQFQERPPRNSARRSPRHPVRAWRPFVCPIPHRSLSNPQPTLWLVSSSRYRCALLEIGRLIPDQPTSALPDWAVSPCRPGGASWPPAWLPAADSIGTGSSSSSPTCSGESDCPRSWVWPLGGHCVCPQHRPRRHPVTGPFGVRQQSLSALGKTGAFLRFSVTCRCALGAWSDHGSRSVQVKELIGSGTQTER